jgi:hypothetical protein
MCSWPQAGQSMRALILGNLRNTFGSVSIAVETGSPVMGHLIITQLMADPPSDLIQPPAIPNGTLAIMEPMDNDRLKTGRAIVDKV